MEVKTTECQSLNVYVVLQRWSYVRNVSRVYIVPVSLELKGLHPILDLKVHDGTVKIEMSRAFRIDTQENDSGLYGDESSFTRDGSIKKAVDNVRWDRSWIVQIRGPVGYVNEFVSLG